MTSRFLKEHRDQGSTWHECVICGATDYYGEMKHEPGCEQIREQAVDRFGDIDDGGWRDEDAEGRLR